MFFTNGVIDEEFVVDKHYVGPTQNHLAPSFHVAIDCYEGYMVLIRAIGEKHPELIWLMKALLSPNLFELAPTFVKLRWNIAVLIPKAKLIFGFKFFWNKSNKVILCY